MLVEAAQALSADPRAMQLRYLQTLSDISSDRTSVVVFPLPIGSDQATAGPLIGSAHWSCRIFVRGRA